MYLTEQEIFSQYEALQNTYDHVMAKRREIKDFFLRNDFSSITFIGCGSSHRLCQSGEISAKVRGLPANSLAAGDLFINFEHYRKMLTGTVIVALSRSGNTSEVLMAVEKAKEVGVSCISFSAWEGSRLAEVSALHLELPWAFDKSVCQTRTVTNLYAANLLLLGIVTDDSHLIEETAMAINRGAEFMDAYTAIAREIAETSAWDKAVVLADSELQGIASEAALALVEIPQVTANFYHVLDFRHGPMVLVDKHTLAIIACSPEETNLQSALVTDLQKRGATVVTIGIGSSKTWGSNWHITVPHYLNYGVVGIPFVFIPQVIGYYKALQKGINPDLPQGLQAWINLDEISYGG